MSRSILLKLLGGTRSSHAPRLWITFWPPFLGAGIRVTHIASDVKAIDVEMKLRWWNAHEVGAHFGGSLFARTDAFYMLMLMANLAATTLSGIRRRGSATASRERDGPRRIPPGGRPTSMTFVTN
jgi:Domain of unknown function (DUF4442)